MKNLPAFSIERKVSKYGVSFGPYFSAFGLNTEIYGVNLWRKSPYSVRIQENTDQKYFSRSVYDTDTEN